MFLVGGLVIVVVILLGLVIIGGHRRAANKTPVAPVDTRTDEERYNDMTTGTSDVSLSDPMIIKFNESTTGTSE